MRKTLSLVLAVLMVLALLPAVKLSAASAEEAVPTYTKVESADDLTDGSYLIVVDSKKIDGAYYAFNGADANSFNKVDVDIADGVIEGDYAANEIKIAAVEGGFTLKNSAGKYLGAGNGSNTIVFGDTAVVNAIDFTEALTVSINMTTDVARELKLNNSNDQSWFRYYKVSTSNANYYLPSLYKKAVTTEPEPEPTTYIVSFDANGGTGTMASVTTTSPYKLPECTFTAPENMVFAYWALEGDEAIYNVNDQVELTGDTTFFAQWQDAPVFTDMELVTEFEGGEQVVIYYPEGSKVLTGEDKLFSETRHELVMADAALTEGVLAVPEEALVLTVEVVGMELSKAGSDEPVRYAFKAADGKYLYADATDVKLVEVNEDNAANTLFQLEEAENGFYIKCDTAVDNNSNAVYCEYYKGYFTAYKMGTAKYYTFQFFAEPGEGPEEPPVIEPSGNTVILFTNDVHCGIREGWGYAGLADLKKTLEAEGNEVILVDAGDHVQGGQIGSLTQGEAIIDIMNFVGYDLATLGNHEFDYGMDQMFALVEQAEYPYVSANFVKVEGNEPVFDAYKIFEANGKKIAFVGLSTPESITKSTPTYFMNEAGEYIYGFCQDDTGASVYTAAQAAIDAAKEEGADYVIIVGHMGIDEQSQPWTAPEVIENVTGVDAFIDGHSHSVINAEVADKEGHMVLHGQTGTKLANVGKLTIAADGTLTMELLPVSEKVQDDPETDEFIKGIEDEFEALLNTVVAHTDHLLTINDADGNRWVRKHETNLGDLCADAYRYMFDSDIAFVNGGGVRANIPEGDITFQQIINVHPFGNTAVLAEVTGQQILDALEMGSRVCPTENGGFLQVAGLTYEIHTYVEPNCVVGSDKMWAGPVDPEGEYRVKNVMIENKETGEYEPLDLEKTYTLASHNYMLMDMGDGFAMFGPNITILEDSGKLDNQVLIDYIQSMPEVDGVHQVEGYTAPEGEGRITIVEEQPVLPATIYGEDVMAADVATDIDNKIYRYDIKVTGFDPETEVVGLQAFVQFDNTALTFLEAESGLEGSTGINENNGVISFAWASNDAGVHFEDGTVVVSLFFQLTAPVANGTKLDFVFVPAENGATTGYSFVSGDSIIEADNVAVKDGSMIFMNPTDLTLYGEDVLSADVMVITENERLYRYDIRVKDLPAAGLKVNSAQIFLSYNDELLELRKAEGKFEWTSSAKNGTMMFVWASETDVLLTNDEVVLSLYFAAPTANGDVAEICFTTNPLNTVSAMSFAYFDQVIEIEANTVDGSITFGERMLGDANCDGQVTAADAALILRALVGLNELSAQGALNADVDDNGEVTAEDAAAILRYIVKLIDKFPAEE